MKGPLQAAVASNTLTNIYLHRYESERNGEDNVTIFR